MISAENIQLISWVQYHLLWWFEMKTYLETQEIKGFFFNIMSYGSVCMLSTITFIRYLEAT